MTYYGAAYNGMGAVYDVSKMQMFATPFAALDAANKAWDNDPEKQVARLLVVIRIDEQSKTKDTAFFGFTDSASCSRFAAKQDEIKWSTGESQIWNGNLKLMRQYFSTIRNQMCSEARTHNANGQIEKVVFYDGVCGLYHTDTYVNGIITTRVYFDGSTEYYDSNGKLSYGFEVNQKTGEKGGEFIIKTVQHFSLWAYKASIKKRMPICQT